MTAPVEIPVRVVGAEQARAALRGVREVLSGLETHAQQRIAVNVDKSALTDAGQRVAAAKAEIKVLEELARARAAVNDDRRRPRARGGEGRAPSERDDWDVISKKIAQKFSAAHLAIDAFQGVVGMATNALRQFSGFVIADVVKPALALETRSAQVANNSNGKLAAKDVEERARALGLKNNMDPMLMIEAAGVFQDLTGEPKVGFDVLDTIATIAKGRGFDTKDIASFAGALYQPGMKAKDLSDLLLAQTAQGTSGSVTIGQIARLGGKVIAPAASLAGDYSTRVAMTGALLQSGKRGFGTPEEAATALQTFMTDAMLHGKQLSRKSFMRDASGVEKLADPAAFIADVYRKTQGNATKLHAMQFSEPTTKLIGSYKETFGEAFKASKAEGKSDTAAREDAARAVEAFIKSFVTASTTIEAEEAKRAAVMKTSGEQLEEALAHVKEKMLVAMPAVVAAVDHLANNVDSVGDAAKTMTEALVTVASTIVDISNGIARVKGWFADDGEVIRTAIDKGAQTKLPAYKTEGYWRKGEGGGYEYVKGKLDESSQEGGSWKRVGAQGSMVFFPGDKAEEEKRKKLDFGFSAPEQNASFDEQNQSSADDASGAGAEAAEEFADNVSRASSAVDKLSSSLEELASRADQLNRSQAFTDRR